MANGQVALKRSENGQLMLADKYGNSAAKGNTISKDKILARKAKDHMQIGIKQNKLMFHFRLQCPNV